MESIFLIAACIAGRYYKRIAREKSISLLPAFYHNNNMGSYYRFMVRGREYKPATGIKGTGHSFLIQLYSRK